MCRGVDLLCSTPQQLYLQDLFGFPHPEYLHVPLICASPDVRLSKRNKDASIDRMLATLKTPEAIVGHIAYISGLIDYPEPVKPEELIAEFSVQKIHDMWCDTIEIPWVAPKN